MEFKKFTDYEAPSSEAIELVLEPYVDNTGGGGTGGTGNDIPIVDD